MKRPHIPDWWPVYWNRGPWHVGWLGYGWNCLFLGKFRVWFKSGPSPRDRFRGWWTT